MARPVGSKNRTPEEILRDAQIAKKKAELKLLEKKKKEEDEKKKKKNAAKK
ncbi:hypothetical protein [Acidocella facilis]|uniref:hypothetical protein n=1 Tax=Acidocella facilis TaxID=525 RepID=UPI001F2E47DE|nr:hypothetical protein [Acidocella facilis]